MSSRVIGERGYTYPVKVNLIVWECPVEGCGVVYGIPKEFADSLRSHGGAYYCPNGHRLSWHETDVDRERKKREAAERKINSLEAAARIQRERAERSERSARAYRGHLTRIKNRIANGVCPVAGCRRSGFVPDRMLKHLHDMHPAWCADHEDAL